MHKCISKPLCHIYKLYIQRPMMNDCRDPDQLLGISMRDQSGAQICCDISDTVAYESHGVTLCPPTPRLSLTFRVVKGGIHLRVNGFYDTR